MFQLSRKIHYFIGWLLIFSCWNYAQAQEIVATSAFAPSIRPNIITVMADDLDAKLASRLLEAGYLPNIKKYLIDSGIEFQNSYVTTSLCCPTRATFLTGQYSHNHKVLSIEINDGIMMLEDANTLAVWLQKSGYHTGLIGRYLNKYASRDTAALASPLNPLYIPPGWDDWQALINFKMFDFSMNSNGRIVHYGKTTGDYQTDVLAKLCVSFIDAAEQDDNKPFFLWVTPFAPHEEPAFDNPVSGCDKTFWKKSIQPAPRHQGSLSAWKLPQTPSFNEPDMSDKPAWVAGFPNLTELDVQCIEEIYKARAESVRAIDDMVGTIAETLEKNGESGNTVLIFTADNGFFHGEHRLFGKVVQYEEGIRVPLYISAPTIAGARKISEFALSNDLAPTISELAGVAPGVAFDGRSLVPLLKNSGSIRWRKRFLVEFIGSLPDIPRTKFFIRDIAFSNSTPRFTGVRTGPDDLTVPNHFFNELNDGTKEYYDLSKDPFQLENRFNILSPTPQSIALEKYLENLKKCGKGNCQTYEDE